MKKREGVLGRKNSQCACGSVREAVDRSCVVARSLAKSSSVSGAEHMLSWDVAKRPHSQESSESPAAQPQLHKGTVLRWCFRETRSTHTRCVDVGEMSLSAISRIVWSFGAAHNAPSLTSACARELGSEVPSCQRFPPGLEHLLPSVPLTTRDGSQLS